MRTFLKFLIDADEHPMRRANIPFALIVLVVMLVVVALAGAGLAWALYDLNPPSLWGYMFVGLITIGFANGASTILGLFFLALRVPEELTKKAN